MINFEKAVYFSDNSDFFDQSRFEPVELEEFNQFKDFFFEKVPYSNSQDFSLQFNKDVYHSDDSNLGKRFAVDNLGQNCIKKKKYNDPLKIFFTDTNCEVKVQRNNRIGEGNYKKVNMGVMTLSQGETRDIVFAKFIRKKEDKISQREIHILTKLKKKFPQGHRGLASALGICQWENKMVVKKGFVFPYFNGGTLQSARTVSSQEAMIIALDLVHGLAALHDLGIVHNDLKPDNICLERDPLTNKITAAFIIDYGISIDLDDPDEKEVLSINLNYSSPELFLEKMFQTGTLDGKSDIYSLGKVLLTFIAKTGELGQLIHQALNENPSLRPSLEKFIEVLNHSEINLEVAN